MNINVSKPRKIIFKHWTRRSYAVFNSLKKIVHIGVLSVSCSLVAVKGQVVFSQIVHSDSSRVLQKELDEIVVSSNAANFFEPIENVVAVVTKEDIHHAAVNNLQDLLRYVQGVDIRTRGGEGVQADISLRGGTFDQYVILLNGINFTDPQTGHHSLNLPIDLSAIERIEILQGPFVWNSGVAGFCGAINIVTLKSDKNMGQVNLSYGEHQYFQTGGIGNILYKKGSLSLSASHSQSDGYSENTDFGINNIYFAGNFQDSKIGRFEFQAGYQQKAFGANSFYSARYKEQYEETKAFIASLNYSKRWKSWQATFNTYYRKHHDRFELFRYAAPDWYQGHNYHLTDVMGGNLKVAHFSSIGLTTVGLDFRNEHIFSSTLGEKMNIPKDDIFDSKGMFYYEKGRKYGSGFLQHELIKKKWNGNIGIMAGGNSKYGIRAYGAASFSYAIRKDLELKYWIQNTYRVPTFTDLYYKSATQICNPNLRPEEGISTELSLQWKPRKWYFNVSGFYRYGFWIIDWIKKTREDEVWYSENMSNVAAMGISMFAEYNFTGAFLKKIRLNYDYLTVNSNTPYYSSLYADNYVRNQIKATIQHSIWKSLSASWLFSLQDRAGSYVDFEKQKDILYKPYILCNLKILWIKKHYEVYVEAVNLFNTSYVDIGNLPQAERWCKAGISIKF